MSPPGPNLVGGWRGRRALVTGATGIVGASLAARLIAEGAVVVAQVHHPDPQSRFFAEGIASRCHVVQGDITEHRMVEHAITRYECDTVFHLAAQALVTVAKQAPAATFEANIRGTWTVLEAARLHPDLVRRVVVASSDKAYGESKVLPYTEDMPLAGRNPYDVSKSCTDLLALGYAASYGLPATVARCGNIYGPGDLHWSRIVPGTLRSLYRNERPVIRSDGTPIRDYIFVEDVVLAYLALGAIEEPDRLRGEAFNFGPGTRVAVLEIARLMGKLTGKEHLEPDIRGTATGEIIDQTLSAEKARRVLGWSVSWSIEEGLRETIPWYQRFFERED